MTQIVVKYWTDMLKPPPRVFFDQKIVWPEFFAFGLWWRVFGLRLWLWGLRLAS